MSALQSVYYTINDTLMMTKRSLLRYIRLPQLLVFSSVQPIMFLVLFNYVFGGAIGTQAPGAKYIDFLLPGILVQVTMFGALQTGIGLADDMGKGIVDRFRSLPMSRAAVVAGRTFADGLRNLVVVAIMLIVGTALGFRFHDGVLGAAGMVAIILLFGYTISWVFAFIGMAVKDSESAQVAGFLFIFPLIFASAAFVPVHTMPGWLQVFVRNQPITQVVNAAREFSLGLPASGASWKALIWAGIILAVFIPLAIRQYKRRVA